MRAGQRLAAGSLNEKLLMQGKPQDNKLQHYITFRRKKTNYALT